ncbi:MAG: hypothetical protein Q7R78_02700 [bacterium]|nr:hypothetical protein [bacterium]
MFGYKNQFKAKMLLLGQEFGTFLVSLVPCRLDLVPGLPYCVGEPHLRSRSPDPPKKSGKTVMNRPTDHRADEKKRKKEKQKKRQWAPDLRVWRSFLFPISNYFLTLLKYMHVPVQY